MSRERVRATARRSNRRMFFAGVCRHLSRFVELDGKRTQKAQVIQLLVAMHKYRGRQTQIVFGDY